MNELIKLSSARINDETVQTCSARDLHRFLGIGKDFSTWVKAQIERAAFAENVDYVKISGKSISPPPLKKRGGGGGIQGKHLLSTFLRSRHQKKFR